MLRIGYNRRFYVSGTIISAISSIGRVIISILARATTTIFVVFLSLLQSQSEGSSIVADDDRYSRKDRQL